MPLANVLLRPRGKVEFGLKFKLKGKICVRKLRKTERTTGFSLGSRSAGRSISAKLSRLKRILGNLSSLRRPGKPPRRLNGLGLSTRRRPILRQ